MRFRQYKFKFYLNARHGIYKNGLMGEIHPHTWEIVINVVKGRDETCLLYTSPSPRDTR